MPPSSLVEIPQPNREFSSNLESLARGGGAKGDFFKLKLAEVRLKAGDFKEALKLASRVSESALSFWKNLTLAESYLAADQPREALTLLKDLPERPRPELSFGEKTYQNLYKRALLTLYHAKTSLSQGAEDEAAELLSLFPGDSGVEVVLGKDAAVQLTTRQRMRMLHVLHFNYQYTKISAFLSPLEIAASGAPREEICRALFELGDGLRRNKGQASESLAAFQEMLDGGCEDKLQARALYWIGMMGPVAQGDDLASQALKKLAADFPGNRLVDDAFYKLYQRAEEGGDTGAAKKYRNQLLSLPKGDMQAKLIFDEGYPLYKKGDYKKAAQVFGEILAKEGAGDESFPQVLYWYGRALEKAHGKKNKAGEVYARLVREFPFSFYAVLAARRGDITLKVPAFPTLKGSAPGSDGGYFALVDELNGDGYHDAAGSVLDLAVHSNPRWQDTHKEFITRKYVESRNYRKALDIAAQHFDSGVYGPVAPVSDPLFAAFYPMAYAGAVKTGYRVSGLPRGVIEGVMREESLFQKNVRSYVGATGLMQLMPGTASMVAKTVPASPTDLTDPENNIILGSTYLRDMRVKFDGQLPLAIMAYNAGPGNVNRFLRNLGHLELDEFIEEIPIAETRGYVKRVMRSMQVYGGLYGEPFFKKSFFTMAIRHRFAKGD